MPSVPFTELVNILTNFLKPNYTMDILKQV
jgi:hypothetical protein